MISLKNATDALTAYTAALNGEVVTPAEAQRRGNICMTCPMKRKVRIRSSDQVSKMLGTHANKNRVPVELRDSKCGVCQCSLMLMVPALGRRLHRDSPDEATVRRENAPGCWVPGAIVSDNGGAL